MVTTEIEVGKTYFMDNGGRVKIVSQHGDSFNGELIEEAPLAIFYQGDGKTEPSDREGCLHCEECKYDIIAEVVA